MGKNSLFFYDRERIEQLIALARRDEYDVCVWGAGQLGKGFGKRILDDLNISIDYYCDNNQSLIGTEIMNGCFCQDFKQLCLRKENTICFLMVGVDYIQPVKRQIQAMGINNLVTYNDLLSLEYIVKRYLPFLQKGRTAIYTCITGDYDELLEPEAVSEQCDYFLVSDQKPRTESIYKWIPVSEVIPRNITDCIMINRYCKMHPHKIFTEYKYSIYHDGNIKMKSDLSEFIPKLGKARIAVSARDYGQNTYVEALRGMMGGRTNNPENLYKQMEKYWNQGLPYDRKAYYCNVLLREHNHYLCVKMMEDWWKEYTELTRRDQISFPYVIWKNGFSDQDVCTICDETIDPYNESPYWILSRGHKRTYTF